MKRRLTFKSTIIILLFIIFIFTFIRQERTMKRIETDIVAEKQKAKELEEKNSKLQAEVDNAQSDEYLEKLARERLGMIREGEVIINSKKEN